MEVKKEDIDYAIKKMVAASNRIDKAFKLIKKVTGNNDIISTVGESVKAAKVLSHINKVNKKSLSYAMGMAYKADDIAYKLYCGSSKERKNKASDQVSSAVYELEYCLMRLAKIFDRLTLSNDHENYNKNSLELGFELEKKKRWISLTTNYRKNW